ncbi:MAG: endonuclease/exonuclease/phosphatase family protein [Yoonia sp.]|uniref:endonuclease/exonuclease/phosphatase family protein n=1 Tax=Yoonia sp. TaxID=2212373 RepID=UPI003EF968A9
MADIRASAADVVTLQEVSHANRPMLAALRDLYPHQVLCAAHSAGAVAVLSQTPLRGETCGLQSGVARAVTTVNGQDVQVVSVHLHWPFPYSQQDHARALIAHLEPLHDGVTVVGGDFNMVASGRSLSWFETAVGATRVGPLVRSYTLFGYPLGIDHILASGGIGTVSVRPQLGSDHYGLLGDIAFP